MDKVVKEKSGEDIDWDSAELLKFFTPEGQLKTPRAHPKKESKAVENLSPATPDQPRQVTKDRGVLWHLKSKGKSYVSSAVRELNDLNHPRYLREFLNFRVYFFSLKKISLVFFRSLWIPPIRPLIWSL